MSKLRLSLLETIRIIGNASGCLQMPERSFFYKGKQFPVCISLLGLMGFDWILQESGFRQSTNPRRLLTGFAGGFGLFSFYIIIMRALTRKTQ